MRSEPAALPLGSHGEHPPRVPLRLRAIRGQLSIDLDAPVEVGPLTVQRLAFSLPSLRFPVDLSGGVGRFRHRRGTLEQLEVECTLARLASFLTPRVRRAWPADALRVAAIPGDFGFVIGLVSDAQALAFHAWLSADDQDLQWIIGDARAVGIDEPAHAAALRVADAALGAVAQRSGSVFVVRDALAILIRDVLIDAGARAPDTSQSTLTGLRTTPEGLVLCASRSDTPVAPPPSVIRAAALARITRDADDALAAGDLEHARERYLMALESAPKHPDIVSRIAQLDLAARASPESALAAVVDAMPALDGGVVAARLLAAVGDHQAACVAARRAAESEPFAPLAALALREAASYATDTVERSALLDDAVARSPALTACRWARAAHRLAIGDTATALVDFGSIEAATRGSPARFEAASKAGAMLLSHGHPADAATFFERALRYSPKSITATTGLARAFMSVGDTRRGASLLSRAVALTARSPDPHADLLIELASALADVARDLPAAIAYVRLVPFGLVQTVPARALEAHWRAMLGDGDGASIAYAQMREAFETLPVSSAPSLVHWLLQAAEFEEHTRRDRRCAFRHIDAALRAAPDNESLRAAFRRLARAEPPQEAPQPSPQTAAEPVAIDKTRDTVPPIPAQVDVQDAPVDLAVAEQRVVALTDRIRANPADHQSASELCNLLALLQRDMDLFALVAARLEETDDPPLRSELTGYKRLALQRLASAARDAQRMDEAAIYEEALAEMDPP